jgi:ATP-dependent Clp protease protease subunit
MKKFWEIKNVTPMKADLYIYGEIVSKKWQDDEVSAQSFHENLKALGDIQTLRVYINSSGGSVFEGQAIYSMLKRHPANIQVHIDGVAASIASVIAMAGDQIIMPSNAMIMIHNPWVLAYGNASELRKLADDLDKIRESLIAAYLNRPNLKMSREKLITMMNQETWLTAQESLELGLIDHVTEAKEIAASISPDALAVYKNVPEQLKNEYVLLSEERQAMIREAKANIEQINQILGVNQ